MAFVHPVTGRYLDGVWSQSRETLGPFSTTIRARLSKLEAINRARVMKDTLCNVLLELRRLVANRHLAGLSGSRWTHLEALGRLPGSDSGSLHVLASWFPGGISQLHTLSDDEVVLVALSVFRRDPADDHHQQ